MLSATPEGIAVDQRVSGFPTSPSDGYDTGTVGSDLVALMDALGHQRFALLGFDTGFLIRSQALHRNARLDPAALHGSFQLYRAFPATTVQTQQRKTRTLTMPVLAIGGAKSGGEGPANTMKLVAEDVQTLVFPAFGPG